MDKAGESTGGALIGALSYGTEYRNRAQRAETRAARGGREKMRPWSARSAGPLIQSDQTIR